MIIFNLPIYLKINYILFLEVVKKLSQKSQSLGISHKKRDYSFALKAVYENLIYVFNGFFRIIESHWEWVRHIRAFLN